MGRRFFPDEFDRGEDAACKPGSDGEGARGTHADARRSFNAKPTKQRRGRPKPLQQTAAQAVAPTEIAQAAERLASITSEIGQPTTNRRGS